MAHGGRDAVTRVLAWTGPTLLTVVLDVDERPPVGDEDVRPHRALVVALSGPIVVLEVTDNGCCWEVWRLGLGKFGYPLDQPPRGVGGLKSPRLADPFVGIDRSGGWWGDHLATFASNVKPLAQPATGIVADLDPIGDLEVVVRSPTGCLDRRRVGQGAIAGF